VAQWEEEYETYIGLAGRDTGARATYEARRQRVHAAFSCADSCAYRVVEQQGRRVIYRGIEYAEFARKVHDIDRSESRSGSYTLDGAGSLVLDRTLDTISDWTDERRAMHSERVRTCVERGGIICGAFDLQPDGYQTLVGAAVLDGEWMGAAHDTLDMYFLFASRNLRDAGVGGALLERVSDEARARGAKQLYISAANGQRTVDFYMRRGAVLATEILTPFGDAGGGAGFGGADIQLVRPLVQGR
jgi:GNAT superfamily N-acetyltransferase